MNARNSSSSSSESCQKLTTQLELKSEVEEMTTLLTNCIPACVCITCIGRAYIARNVQPVSTTAANWTNTRY